MSGSNTFIPIERSKVKLAFLPRSKVPRMSFLVEHETAILAAVDALDIDELQRLLNQSIALPFWSCIRSVCHSYNDSSKSHYTRVVALILHATCGTWIPGEPLPNDIPSHSQCDIVLCNGINEALFGPERWSQSAFRVLLSLGVSQEMDPITLEEIRLHSDYISDYIGILADHFGPTFLRVLNHKVL